MGDEPSYLDDVHREIAEFAERHFDDEDERATFVDTLLERKGYKRVSQWAPPEPPKGGGGPKNKPSYFRK